MENDKLITIDVNKTRIRIWNKGESITINFDNQKIRKELLNDSNSSLKDIVLSAVPQLKHYDLLDDETVLKIIDIFLEIIKSIDPKRKKDVRKKRDELEEKISKSKEMVKSQGRLDAQENQSKGKTNEDFLNEWINEGNYSKCANMLKSLRAEKGEEFLEEFLENLLRQENGHKNCIEILLRLREYAPEEEEIIKIISEIDKNIPADMKVKMSLGELRAKISSAEDEVMKSSLEMLEQEIPSEETLGDEDGDKDDLEEFIATLNLEELVSSNPVPDAIIKGVEIEMHIEHHKDKTVNEGQGQEQQEENEERHQNEHNEDIGIEENEDKDDSEEQLQNAVNQLMEELAQLNRQILEIDEQIKRCDEIIDFYSIYTTLKIKQAKINEIYSKKMLRKLNDNEEKNLEQLTKEFVELNQTYELLRRNASIPEYETEEELKNALAELCSRKFLNLRPASEELKAKRDDIKIEIREITGSTDEKDKQNFERL